MSLILFNTIDWTGIEKVEYQGISGTAIWQTIQFDGL
jgi:hypothetical protein